MIVPLRLAALLAAVTLLAGCGSSDDDGAVGTTTETTETTQATETTGGIDPMPDASTEPVSEPARNTETALLTDVRWARHEGFDRVVFEFRNELPGYDVRYVERPVRADGSGNAVRVGGNAVVQVRMENALDADLTDPSAPLTYEGPTRIAAGLPEVVELVRIGGFEAVLTWAVGLWDRVDFRAITLRKPPRLVVDFRNH